MCAVFFFFSTNINGCALLLITFKMYISYIIYRIIRKISSIKYIMIPVNDLTLQIDLTIGKSGPTHAIIRSVDDFTR